MSLVSNLEMESKLTSKPITSKREIWMTIMMMMKIMIMLMMVIMMIKLIVMMMTNMM